MAIMDYIDLDDHCPRRAAKLSHSLTQSSTKYCSWIKYKSEIWYYIIIIAIQSLFEIHTITL